MLRSIVNYDALYEKAYELIDNNQVFHDIDTAIGMADATLQDEFSSIIDEVISEIMRNEDWNERYY